MATARSIAARAAPNPSLGEDFENGCYRVDEDKIKGGLVHSALLQKLPEILFGYAQLLEDFVE